MHSTTVVALVASLFVVDVLGQLTSDNCLNFPPKKDADLSKAGGLWYYTNVGIFGVTMPAGLKCVTRDISLNADGSVGVKTKIIDGAGDIFTADGTAVPIGGDTSKLQVTNFGITEVAIVVDIDDAAWGILVECVVIDGVTGHVVGVFSRQKTLTPDSRDNVQKVLDKAGLPSLDSLQVVDQQNC